MNTSPILYENTFSLPQNGDWLPLLKDMMAGNYPGLLGTVDAHNQPQMRWMSTLSLDFFPLLYALTSSDCRKVHEIDAHPAVTWMFFNRDLSFIVTLRGTARVLTDMPTIRSVSRQLKPAIRAAYVDKFLVGQTVVLETKIDSVECSSPGNSFEAFVRASDLDIGRERLETFEDRSVLTAG